ncbi:dnaJ homolog subfamily C member 5B-like [Symsagittifera roscoffensis]|uniref:dnaJ homolog subfamily C member 5B-like n=1 Tax=Symsagittifera roscoffensis TaxID=84072 RepID=UPI00307B8B06
MAPQHCRCRKGTVPRAFTRQGFTLYERLDLEKDHCTEKDIVKQYKRLTDENHPDKHPDDEERKVKFVQVSEAYAVLSDPKKKEVYDKFGSLGIHVGQLVGYNKVEKYLTKRSAGYKFTTVMIFLLTGCCFCCCCYFCFCFCCGLCLPKRDTKTARGIKEGRIESQNPYEKHMDKGQKSWKEKVVTEQPRNNSNNNNSRTKEEKKRTPTTPQVEIKDSDSSNDEKKREKDKDVDNSLDNDAYMSVSRQANNTLRSQERDRGSYSNRM